MKVPVFFLALWAAQESYAAPSQGYTSPANALLEPVLARRDLGEIKKNLEIVKKFSKRSPQISIPVALLGGIYNTIDNFWTEFPQLEEPRVEEKVSPKWGPDVKHKKIRYGPFRIPGVREKTPESILLGMEGVTNAFDYPATKPCEQCVLLGINASMEYADGTIAETSNGGWLHHVVLFNNGPHVKEAICGGGSWEPIFESGNERTEVKFAVPASEITAGYHVGKTSNFTLNAELMNMDNEEKFVWVTLDYDYVEGYPEEYLESKPVWLSIGPNRCEGESNVNPFGPSNLTESQQPTKMELSENSIPWELPYDGWLIGSNGHMHDGGVDIEIFLNNERLCSTPALYSSDGITMGGHGHLKRQVEGSEADSRESDHIYGQLECLHIPAIRLHKGDKMHIRANYNFTLHPGMVNAHGELDEVMGIVGALIAFEDYPVDQ